MFTITETSETKSFWTMNRKQIKNVSGQSDLMELAKIGVSAEQATAYVACGCEVGFQVCLDRTKNEEKINQREHDSVRKRDAAMGGKMVLARRESRMHKNCSVSLQALMCPRC